MWARRAARHRALLIGSRLASALTANSSAILLLSRNFGSVVTARLDFAAYSKVIEARQSLPRRFISSKSNTSRGQNAGGDLLNILRRAFQCLNVTRADCGSASFARKLTRHEQTEPSRAARDEHDLS